MVLRVRCPRRRLRALFRLRLLPCEGAEPVSTLIGCKVQLTARGDVRSSLNHVKSGNGNFFSNFRAPALAAAA